MNPYVPLETNIQDPIPYQEMGNSSSEESVFFENSDTKVTNVEFIHYSESHLIKNIPAIETSEETPSKTGGVIALIISLLLIPIFPPVFIIAAACIIYLATLKKTHKITFPSPKGDIVVFSTHDSEELHLVNLALNKAINTHIINTNPVG